MEWDDAKPRPAPVSVADLEQRVRDLEAEIVRVKAALAGKKSHTAAADALFKR
jgi:uncharacterized small protein (DUF1192 family)